MVPRRSEGHLDFDTVGTGHLLGNNLHAASDTRVLGKRLQFISCIAFCFGHNITGTVQKNDQRLYLILGT